MPERYQSFEAALRQQLPKERLITDPLRTLAYGTDASFYRLIPKLVVQVEQDDEIRFILECAERFNTPVTFRAAGTSLSGQAITDSVLLLLSGNAWQNYAITPDGGSIRLQPGIIGAMANNYLKPYQRKIGPDPASINAAKIGGIAANNASGMCCGTAQNSYQTLQGMRVVLADGAVLDTNDAQSIARFRETHAPLLDGLRQAAETVAGTPELVEKIRHKYRLKNTTGYSLNALVDFQDPVEMLQHLMIGSEGTLGFISEITYRTVPDHPCKTTSLVLFPDIETACLAVAALKHSPVAAVELMDRAALHSIEDKPDMPTFLRGLHEEVAALLIDVRAEDDTRLLEQVAQVTHLLHQFVLVRPAEFTRRSEDYQRLWNIRKGLFPAVGAVRQIGTTVIIEDIAFPVAQLAAGVRDLQGLFEKYGYTEALIFGHALEGNLHFVFTQDFGTESEVQRYQQLMDAVCHLVVDDYGGSLKAEHGTGRNIAPFVEMEWGSDAYQLMWQLKRLFDPKGILNPGVILNEDAGVHLKNLKPLPAADALVDRCIECGFCEAVCPSRNLTLTPRQRIVAWRELSRCQRSGESAVEIEKAFAYQGIATCAADGLCATRCPVGIDTGALIRSLRGRSASSNAQRIGQWMSDHFSTAERLTAFGLQGASLAQGVLGDERLARWSKKLHNLSNRCLPLWNPATPKPATNALTSIEQPAQCNGEVIYFPSCASRTMGPAKEDPDQRSLRDVMLSLMRKADYKVILPPSYGHCCGLPLESHGLEEAADGSLQQLEAILWKLSDEGRIPVLCDTSPCVYRMQQGFKKTITVFETVGFIHNHLLPHLQLVQQVDKVALHITCSSRKMGLEEEMIDLAQRCTRMVIQPEEQGCCGFAGDKGFTVPELNAAALSRLAEQIPEDCHRGYSNSRTCEIGLSNHSGIPYQSIAYLVDACYGSAAMKPAAVNPPCSGN